MSGPCFVFDFDGTLVDSMPIYAETVFRILKENGVGPSEGLIKTIATMGTVRSAEYLSSLGISQSPEEVLGLMKRYLLDAYCHTIPLKEGVLPALSAWKEKGIPLSVLTASPHISLDPCLKRLGIYDWFDHIWSTDDFSLSKTDPALYRKVAQELGDPPTELSFLTIIWKPAVPLKKLG
jgi:beta-phosphoglucomutase-like phosphatase (HAD superfamily)